MLGQIIKDLKQAIGDFHTKKPLQCLNEVCVLEVVLNLICLLLIYSYMLGQQESS